MQVIAGPLTLITDKSGKPQTPWLRSRCKKQVIAPPLVSITCKMQLFADPLIPIECKT
jgi:hypothetical protein